MQEFFDTHCHLSFPDFDADRDDVVARARASGVSMLSIGTCVETSRRNAAIAQSYEGVYAAIGIHPNHAHEAEPGDMAALRDLAASNDRVIALGETGLDYCRDYASPEDQKKYLRLHLDLARELVLPVILHARSAGAEVLEEVESFAREGGRAVWHCFTARKKEIDRLRDRAIEMGLYLGVSGMVTFEDGGPLRKSLLGVPDKHLLLDTDAPFLIPKPKITDRNEPTGAIRIAEALAELRGVTVDDIARITTRNARAFLGLSAPEQADPLAGVAYRIRDSLYLSLTNDCNNNCVFCARNEGYVVKGHDIRLHHDPDAEEVIRAMGDTDAYDEVVFCGFGEPTLRLEVLKAVAEELKRRGRKVRLNTNGLANLHYGRDIVPDLVGRVDTVSISLNTADPAQYEALCRPRFGDAAYPALCEFARKCVGAGLHTLCSAVAMPGIDIAAARAKAESLGAEFRERSYVDAG